MVQNKADSERAEGKHHNRVVNVDHPGNFKNV